MAMNDILRAVLGFSQDGEKWVNVLHFRQESADGSLGPEADLAAAIVEDMLPSYLAVLSSDVECQTITAGRISPTEGGPIITAVGSAGTVVQEPYPPNSSAVGTLYTATISARGRGRIHMAGVPRTFAEGGRINNADAATYVTFLDTFLANIQGGAGATFRPGVWSATAAAFYPITDHQLRSQLRTLRSRRMSNP